jgi:hypothetical protein
MRRIRRAGARRPDGEVLDYYFSDSVDGAVTAGVVTTG